MHIGNKDSDDEVVPNLTPMIDVVFLLLIFFMVATTFANLEKEMDLKLPEAISGRAEEMETDEVIINVLEDGRLKVGTDYYDLEGLVERLKRAQRANPDIPVMIRADKNTVHQNTMNAMEACGRANLIRISIGIRSEQN